MDIEDAKNIWFNWFIANKKYWCYGLTYAKIQKIKILLWSNNDVWYDLLKRHNMIDEYPWNIQYDDNELYNHAIGNFSGSISQIAHNLHLIT